VTPLRAKKEPDGIVTMEKKNPELYSFDVSPVLLINFQKIDKI
jgi:hypothetical protein